MLKVFLIYVLLAFANLAYAITPQQYCSALEVKQKNSYELLNAESFLLGNNGIGSMYKICYRGRFCYGNNIFTIKQAVDSFSGTFTGHHQGIGSGFIYTNLGAGTFIPVICN